MKPFRNRAAAGRLLADALVHYADEEAVCLLALPRGGVPVGFEVATRLHSPLGIFLVRKLGAPGHEEFAMGAVASGGLWFVRKEVVKKYGLTRHDLQLIVEREERELERQAEVYGREFTQHDVRERTVILMDDGLATGSTMRAAVNALKQQHPARIVVAVPVASVQSFTQMSQEVDEVVCLEKPDAFNAVGEWYEDFSQTTDDEVCQLLEKASALGESMPCAPWPNLF